MSAHSADSILHLRLQLTQLLLQAVADILYRGGHSLGESDIQLLEQGAHLRDVRVLRLDYGLGGLHLLVLQGDHFL